MACLVVIEMEGLRIELGREAFDRCGVDDPQLGGEFLADLQILEIAGPGHRAGHRAMSVPLLKSAGRRGRNQTPDATAADNMIP